MEQLSFRRYPGPILLTSAGFENPEHGHLFLHLVGKPVGEIVVLFVPTAALTAEAKHCVELSRQELLGLGIREQHIRVQNLEHRVQPEDAGEYDAIYVCGGNTLHLLNRVKETGFDQLISQCLAAGKTYVGVSAGSIMMGPSVRGTLGLCLVDFVVLPHYQGDERQVKELEETVGHKVIPLTDMQAVLVKDGKSTLV